MKKVGETEGTRTLSGIPDGGSIVILGFLSATNPDKEEEKAEVEGRKGKISSQLLRKSS